MFQSYEYIKYLPETDEYQYRVVDDEGCAAEVAESEVAPASKVYTKKGKSTEEIGMNIALLVLYCNNKFNSTTEQETQWQDQYCPKYINNWKEIATYRDKHLQLLQLFQ